MELEDLIPLLAACKVRRFKGKGIEIEFEVQAAPGHAASQKDSQASAPAANPNPQTAPSKAVEFPEGLRADDLMKEGTILNWSAPPSADEPVMPLTGEAPIEPPTDAPQG